MKMNAEKSENRNHDGKNIKKYVKITRQIQKLEI